MMFILPAATYLAWIIFYRISYHECTPLRTCHVYHSIPYVAVNFKDLDREVSGAIGAAWAPNTVSTRNSQWKKYLTFCSDNCLIAIPAETQTVVRFLVFLARSVKFSTINNYMSAINKLHEYYGHSVNYRDFFMIKLVLSGPKSQLGDDTVQKILLTPRQLLQMHKLIDLQDPFMHAMWCAIVLSFRSLLRKSNIVPVSSSVRDHVLTRRDVLFTKDGMILHVHSTKTIQYHGRVLEIPLLAIPGSPLCTVSLLKDHFNRFPMPDSALLFYHATVKGPQPILYNEVLGFLKGSGD